MTHRSQTEARIRVQSNDAIEHDFEVGDRVLHRALAPVPSVTSKGPATIIMATPYADYYLQKMQDCEQTVIHNRRNVKRYHERQEAPNAPAGQQTRPDEAPGEAAPLTEPDQRPDAASVTRRGKQEAHGRTRHDSDNDGRAELTCRSAPEAAPPATPPTAPTGAPTTVPPAVPPIVLPPPDAPRRRGCKPTHLREKNEHLIAVPPDLDEIDAPPTLCCSHRLALQKIAD